MEKNKKLKSNWIKYASIGVICLLVVGIVFSINNTRKKTKDAYVKVGDQYLNKVEYEFFENTYKNNFKSAYIDTGIVANVDLEKDLSKQKYKDGKTWEDFFRDGTEKTIKETYVLNKEYEKNKKQDKFKNIDKEDIYKEFISFVDEQAKASDTTRSEMIHIMFGPNADENNIKECVTKFTIASRIPDMLIDDYKITDDDINKYYDEHRDDYDTVSFRMLEIPYERYLSPDDYALDPDSQEYENKLKESSEKVKEAAQKIGSNIKDEKSFIASIDDFLKEFNIERTYKGENGKGDITEYKDYEKAMLGNKIAKWAFDEKRKEGDSIVINDEESNTYQIAYFINRQRDENKTATVRQIVINSDGFMPRDDYDLSKTSDKKEHDKDLSEARNQVAIQGKKMMEEWNKSKKTEADFTNLYKEYATYKDDNYGLFPNQEKDNFVDAVKNWIFNQNRKTGDTNSFINRDYISFIYFDSYGDPTWKNAIRWKMKSEMFAKDEADKIKNVDIEYVD